MPPLHQNAVLLLGYVITITLLLFTFLRIAPRLKNMMLSLLEVIGGWF